MARTEPMTMDELAGDTRPGLDIEEFFDNATVGLHLVGSDGTILRANRADYEPLGYSRDEYIGKPIANFHADSVTIEDILRRLSAGEKLDKYPARLRAKDGSVRHVQISSSVCFRDGKFANTRCVTVDVTDRVRAEAELREAQDRLAATYESVLAGIAECDSEGRFLRVNEAFCAISGYTREELLEKTFFDITHPDDLARDKAEFERQVAGECHKYLIEKRYVRKDGDAIWVEVLSSTVHDQHGGFGYGVRMIRDVTERRLADEHKKLLLDELNHRVKNTLATVQALAAHTARQCTSAEEFQKRFEPRLIALSKAHDRLTENDWRGANLADIVNGEVSAHSVGRFSVDGPDLIIPPRSSLSLSMALHELATNAAKHGALSVPEGRVSISWTVERDGGPYPKSFALTWKETGGRPPVAPDREGFGSRLLRATAAELNGRMVLDYQPDGLCWSISAPVAEGAASG